MNNTNEIVIEEPKYFDDKKKQGLIFTRRNMDKDDELTCLNKERTEIIHEPKNGLSYWSRELHRYRTEEEQKEYYRRVIANNSQIRVLKDNFSKAYTNIVEERERKLIEKKRELHG